MNDPVNLTCCLDPNASGAYPNISQIMNYDYNLGLPDLPKDPLKTGF